MTKKYYEKRNLRKLGKHYLDHSCAMSSEGLHSRVAIAAELAHRDMIIEELLEQLKSIVPGLTYLVKASEIPENQKQDWEKKIANSWEIIHKIKGTKDETT